MELLLLDLVFTLDVEFLIFLTELFQLAFFRQLVMLLVEFNELLDFVLKLSHFLVFLYFFILAEVDFLLFFIFALL